MATVESVITKMVTVKARNSYNNPFGIEEGAVYQAIEVMTTYKSAEEKGGFSWNDYFTITTYTVNDINFEFSDFEVVTSNVFNTELLKDGYVVVFHADEGEEDFAFVIGDTTPEKLVLRWQEEDYIYSNIDEGLIPLMEEIRCFEIKGVITCQPLLIPPA